MFCGRLTELEYIEHCLVQTQNGNAQNFLIEGERGIGKSSLLLFEELVASGQIKTKREEYFRFITVSISLYDGDTLFTIIKKISDKLKSRLAQKEKLKNLVLKAVNLLSKIEAAGFKLNNLDDATTDEDLISTLQDDFVSVILSLDDNTDGLLLLIDEADKPAATAHLGLLCKLLTEELSKRQCDRLCIGLAGLPNLISKLRESHESSLRVFKNLTLKPLEPHERKAVIDRGLKEATQKNRFETEITDSAKSMIANLSEGYPHFLQEFAYCAFEQDSDNKIDDSDVLSSLVEENGAFEQLGRKYFNQFYNIPKSDDYRVVLDEMANHLDEWVDRATIIKESKLKESIVDNALRTLKSSGAIVQHESRRGEYRLPTKSFAAWIRIGAQARKKSKKGKKASRLF
jgi:hypothetical protein